MKTYHDKLKAAGFPTDVLVIDFENYFDDDYSITKLQTIEYITDPRFEFTGVGWQELHKNDGVSFFHDVDLAITMLQIEYGDNFERVTVVAHNARYDITILQEKFNIVPPYVVDTADLARHYDSRMSHSLKDLAKMFKLEDKGETSDFKGLHLSEMTPEQRDNLAEYGKKDIRITAKLFPILMRLLTWAEIELPIARHTLGLYLSPQLNFDFTLSTEIFDQMNDLLNEIIKPTGCSKKLLGSKNNFVMVLGNYLPEGEVVPYKAGKNEMIPALSKDDEQFQLLLAHADPKVRQLCEARMAVKSWPLHINRVKRMRSQALASYGSLRVPLNYYGCHCVPGDSEVLTRHGWMKLEDWNMGDIMQWEPDGSMKFAPAKCYNFGAGLDRVKIDSPYVKAEFTAGHTIPRFGTGNRSFMPCKADQLSRKMVSYLPISGTYKGSGSITSKQMQLLIAVQADGHWQLKTKFGRELRFGLTKVRKQVRLRCLFKLNKVEFREQTFKSHPGEITFRVRWTDLPKWLAPDRKIFGSWLLDSTQSAREIFIPELEHWDGHKSGNLEYYSALDANHEWVAIMAALTRCGAKRQEDRPMRTIIRQTRSPELAMVRERHVTWIKASSPYVYCPETETGYWLMRQNGTISITGNTGRPSGGEKINLLNLGGKGRKGMGTHKLITLVRRLLIAPPGKTLVINDSAQIEARLLSWLAGQDGLTAGFANNEDIYSTFASQLFGVEVRKPTDGERANPDLKDWVHDMDMMRGFGKDAILGAGYGMGVQRFYDNCRSNPDLRPLFDNGTYTRGFIERLIKTYRKMYHKIPEFWREVEALFKFVIRFPNEVATYDLLGESKLKFWNDNGTVCIQLPSGRVLYYRHAAVDRDNNIRWQWGHLWGGSITENIIQSIGADLLRLWILDCEDVGIPVVTHCYDEIVGLVNEQHAEWFLSVMDDVMCAVPDWAEGCPMASEGMISKFYKK